MALLNTLKQRGFDTRVALPQLDHRYFVYMLGRGVLPPSNTFCWCTPKLKVMSLERELEILRQQGEKFLCSLASGLASRRRGITASP